jgi:hypothetical protein
MAAEFCQEYEEAAENTRHTRSLDDLLKKNRGKTVEPAATYTDVKLNIGTYCGLLWTIFGDHGDYYKELLKIYRILDLRTRGRYYAHGLRGRSSMRGARSSDETPLLRTLHQG